ncbi:MAG TPA: DUF1553 domain-containing protein [Pirellulales bacterium]|nr:DUF1553 domain-containing protein [Pirellulales bacterium]
MPPDAIQTTGRWMRGVLAGLVCWLSHLPPLAAGEPQVTSAMPEPARLEFFEKQVRPLLAARCHECHGARRQKGGLRLDSRAAALAGGESGPVVVPGKPDESLLVDAVRYGQVFQMPPKGKLPDAEVAALVEWVRQGAPWPKDDPSAEAVGRPSAAEGEPLFTSEQRAFWAFRPPADPPPPPVKNGAWPKGPLDHFILAGLEARGLWPAPPADKRALIRRASYDLIGLPPTPGEVEAFLADESPDAFGRVVDRLLASPLYGQRWGRHWLDVARYADSNGLDENLAYVNAYRYRDYVVSAFNRDLPFDQFVIEQLAGDLLPPAADEAIRHERMVATGFLTLGAKMLAEDDPVKMEMDIIDEQLDTIGTTFMGLTIGCARCHDHKFDPVPTADYYSLAGIFKSTKTMENFNVVAVWHERPLAAPERIAAVEEHQERGARKKSEIDGRVKEANDAIVAEIRRDAARYLLAAALLDAGHFTLEPRMSNPAADQPTGAIVIEAEKFDRGQATKLFDGYGAGIGVIASFGPEASFAEYDVDLPSEGVYQIELRYAADASRPCDLLIDGQLLKHDAAKERTGTWNPDTQTWFAEALVSLSARKHTLRLQRREPFPHLDRLALVPRRPPDGVDPEIYAFPAPEAADRRWNRAVLDGWVRYLARTKHEPTSALHAWHVWQEAEGEIAKFDTVKFDANVSPVVAAVLREPRPKSAEELAERYGQLFLGAQNAWKELKQSPAGASADKLADPALEALRQVLDDPQGPFALPPRPEAHYTAETKAELARLRDELADLQRTAPPPLPLAMAVEERAVTNVRVHVRGNHLTQGEEVPRRFPRIIAGGEQPSLSPTASGRLELAQWLTRPNHPLTGRVLVNRVWRGHFGEGLVRTPDNFGRLGERPTHPELLDWLTRRFVENGWSIKSLHRLIMHSAAYQMSTAFNAEAAAADPDNRLCWRMNRRRLEAEAVRDAILAASGRLDPALEGTLLNANPRQYVASTNSVDTTQYESFRRSLYLPVIRSALYDVFQAFDFAEPSVANGGRASTTVAPQALFMMNSSLVGAETRHLAATLLANASADDAGRVGVLYARALGRPPSAADLSRALEFVGRMETNTAWQSLEPAERRLRAWQSLCRVLMSSSEFIYVE